MPIHDWSRAEDGLYRLVHNAWLIHLVEHLNGGALPPGHYALTDARVDVFIPDVAAVRRRAAAGWGGGTATLPAADRRAAVALQQRNRQRRLKVFDADKRVVAVVEVVSPANKDRRSEVADFAAKAAAFLAAGVNVTVADILPPGPADPDGMHPPVWEALDPAARADRPPADRPLTFAGYRAGKRAVAHLYYAAVGRPVPTVPLFLGGRGFVPLPLEETYTTTIDRLTPELRATLGG